MNQTQFADRSTPLHWRELWSRPPLRREVVLTAMLLCAILFTLTKFLESIEVRPGLVLSDPILMSFRARDVTWLTFLLIYLGLFAGLLLLYRHPERLILAVQSYIVMVVVRMVAMYVVPLDPPSGMIALQDPFVEYLGTGKLLTKDLFFSGHTATLLLLFLTVQGRKARMLFLGCTIAVGICVLLQHVHYTIDVVAAPFFSYGSYRVALLVREHRMSRLMTS